MKASADVPTSSRSLRELWSKVRHIDIAMLTTVDKDGTLHCRPMSTQAVEREEFLWFFAGKDSGKVKAIRANPAVGLAYADSAKHIYVMASGNARVTDNDQKARELWGKAAQAWFPGGPEDSSLVLICVDVDHAQYWDGAESGSFKLT